MVDVDDARDRAIANAIFDQVQGLNDLIAKAASSGVRVEVLVARVRPIRDGIAAPVQEAHVTADISRIILPEGRAHAR
ncbi:MAG TPA: hypothetical protein VNH45_11210 [Gaiellaceae bacterium]|nr:hypothetical protein [Gaiellaceae bacterium]